VDQISFFSNSDPQFFFNSNLDKDSDLNTNNLTRSILKWSFSLLSSVFWNLYDRGKSFRTEKRTFFSLSSVRSAIFQIKFLFYNSVWVRIRTRIRPFFRIRIRPKLTDSFGFGSTTLVSTDLCKHEHQVVGYVAQTLTLIFPKKKRNHKKFVPFAYRYR
jgi:hypothetical protein